MNLIDRTLAAFKAFGNSGAASYSAVAGDAGGNTLGSLGTAAVNGGSNRWAPRARDARADTVPALTMERGKSRELARTSPIACGAINTNVDRIVGTGLALSAQPNRAILGWSTEQALAWKRQVQAEFSLWADSAESDQSQTLNFFEQQALVLRATLESGDCFTLLPDAPRTRTQPYALRIQVLEADRVGNPLGHADTDTLCAGVRFAPDGAPQAYHLYDRHPGAGYFPGGKTLLGGQFIERLGGKTGRRRILHHYRKLRPDMPRGVPYLAPIVDCIKQISRYSNAEIAAAVISSYFTVFVETTDGNSAPIFTGSEGDIDTGDSAGSEAAAAGVHGLGMGAMVGLAKGEKVSFANPNRPNPNFEPFLLGVLSQIGMALGIPRELLIKQFNASYSASKAALLDAWIYFRSVRTWLARSFCQPVYETWLSEAIATGRIAAPGYFTDPLMRWAYTRAAWHGDSMGSINPKDEVAGYVAAIDARIMTRERAEWEMFGSDFNETFDQKLAEHQILEAAGMLPVPKAGAAAPANAKPDADADPADSADNTAPADSAEQAATRGMLAELRSNLVSSLTNHLDRIELLSARPQSAPSIVINNPPVTVHTGATHVTLPEGCVQVTANAGDTHVTLPEGCIQLEAHVDAPAVTVNALPAPVTVLQAPATRQTITRDAQGEIAQIVTTAIHQAAEGGK